MIMTGRLVAGTRIRLKCQKQLETVPVTLVPAIHQRRRLLLLVLTRFPHRNLEPAMVALTPQGSPPAGKDVVEIRKHQYGVLLLAWPLYPSRRPIQMRTTDATRALDNYLPWGFGPKRAHGSGSHYLLYPPLG